MFSESCFGSLLGCSFFSDFTSTASVSDGLRQSTQVSLFKCKWVLIKNSFCEKLCNFGVTAYGKFVHHLGWAPA